MKASLTTESTGAFFDPTVAAHGTIERTNELVRDGLTITPWREGLPIWRAALTSLSGATFYHSELWIEALRASYPLRLEVATLRRDGELRAAAVFARSKGILSTRLVSLPFSDCGGPLAVDDASSAELLRLLASSTRASSIEVRGAVGPEPWKNVHCFGHWTLDLKRPFAEISSGFSRTVRGGIKRGLKDNVQIECGSDATYLSRFYDLQLKTRRRLGVPPQPFKFFAAVHQTFARGGDFEVWFATFEGNDHAALVLLRDGDQLCYKWGARIESGHPGANHLLVAKMIESHAGNASSIDFGRCDMRNQGLVRSKSELGCVAHLLPYAFFPEAPHHISSEVLHGPAKILSTVLKRLPLPVTRVIGEALYRYMA
jgi:hypothetical protein